MPFFISWAQHKGKNKMPYGIYDHKKNYKLTPKRLEQVKSIGFKKGHEFLGDLSKPNYFKNGNHPKTEFKIGQNTDDKHSQWKGDLVGYYALHSWVKRKKGNPHCCEHCGKIGMKVGNRWNIEWANIDHKYRRVLEDYFGLCKDCHRDYDNYLKLWQ